MNEKKTNARWPIVLKEIVDQRKPVWLYDAGTQGHANGIAKKMKQKYFAEDSGLLVTIRGSLVIVINLEVAMGV